MKFRDFSENSHGSIFMHRQVDPLHQCYHGNKVFDDMYFKFSNFLVYFYMIL